MRYLIDTSVLSQTQKQVPHPAAIRWWQVTDPSEMALSAVVLHELRFGIELMAAGQRRDSNEAWLRNYVLRLFSGRILPVDSEVADAGGRLLAAAKHAGHTAKLGDVLLAATAKVHGLQVATLNVKDFEWLGVAMVEFS